MKTLLTIQLPVEAAELIKKKWREKDPKLMAIAAEFKIEDISDLIPIVEGSYLERDFQDREQHLEGVLRLYKIYSDKFDDETICVLSTISDIAELRKYFGNWDHGGQDADKFYELLNNGKIIEVMSLEEVPKEWRGCYPYTTDEILPNGEDLIGMRYDGLTTYMYFQQGYFHKNPLEE